jgi:hypothetical protein
MDFIGQFFLQMCRSGLLFPIEIGSSGHSLGQYQKQGSDLFTERMARFADVILSLTYPSVRAAAEILSLA